MRVLVCGGRDYRDYDKVWAKLDAMHKREPITLLIEGGAQGADTYAYQWALARKVPRLTIKADWETHSKAAGAIRNAAMLKMEPDVVVAFPGGKGTNNMMTQTRRAGVKLVVVKE